MADQNPAAPNPAAPNPATPAEDPAAVAARLDALVGVAGENVRAAADARLATEATLAPTDAPNAVEAAEADDGMDDVLTEAQDAFFDGNFRGTVDLAKRVLAVRPTDPGAYEILALALMALNQYDLAAETASLWAQVAPNNRQQMICRLQSAYLASDFALCTEAAEAILRDRSANEENALLARVLYHDLRREQGQASRDAPTPADLLMHIPTDPDQDPAADVTARKLPQTSQIVRLWGIACERDMEDATIQSMLGLLQSWEATPDASPDSELNRALAVGWALLGTWFIEAGDLDQVQALLTKGDERGLGGNVNLRVLWALAAIESLPDDPEPAEGAEEAPLSEEIARMRALIGTALRAGRSGHWLLARRAHRCLAS